MILPCLKFWFSLDISFVGMTCDFNSCGDHLELIKGLLGDEILDPILSPTLPYKWWCLEIRAKCGRILVKCMDSGKFIWYWGESNPNPCIGGFVLYRAVFWLNSLDSDLIRRNLTLLLLTCDCGFNPTLSFWGLSYMSHLDFITSSQAILEEALKSLLVSGITKSFRLILCIFTFSLSCSYEACSTILFYFL